MNMLRFMTAGSVDDGKSTLIGRLLYDSQVLLEDQLHAIATNDERKINLAFVTDGLKAERDQGITIDVAYRYFSTAKRKFIVIDAPGHVQYTRNMITAASQAQAMLLMIDARHGLVEQTKRHAFIASLMGIKTMIVCVNKMDLVGYHQAVFENIVSDFRKMSEAFRNVSVHFIPISALNGDNVVRKSEYMNWYNGPALLELLESLPPESSQGLKPLRLSVQQIILHNNHQAVSGFIWSGSVRVGDKLRVVPEGSEAEILSIESMKGTVESSASMRSVTMTLSDGRIKRGDLIVSDNDSPQLTDEFDVTCCWLDDKLLRTSAVYILRIGTMECNCTVVKIQSRMNIHTMTNESVGGDVFMNDIVRLRLKTSSVIPLDNYYQSRYTGSMILIDPDTGETSGAAVYDEQGLQEL